MDHLTLGAKIGFMIVGLILMFEGMLFMSRKLSMALYRFKQRHPWMYVLLRMRGLEGTWRDDELTARGAFKTFAGILTLVFGLLIFAAAAAF